LDWAFLTEEDLALKHDRETTEKLAIDAEMNKIQRSLVLIEQTQKKQTNPE
jgi:hypothetical protein